MDWLIKNLSTLGPIGKSLPAPGTFGSIAGVICFALILWFSSLPPLLVILFFSLLFILGIPICSRAEILLGKTDPSEVIWDEFTAVPMVYLFCLEELKEYALSNSVILLIMGFVLFRIFDIVKPLGIQSIQRLPGGLGVMLDDFAAALISAVFLYLVKTFPLSF